METSVRRYFSIVELAMIALCSLFLARATAHVVASRIPPLPSRAAPQGPHFTAPVVGTAELLRRNIFCSSCLPASGEAAPAPAAGPIRTAMALTLVAVLWDQRRRPAGPLGAVLRDTEQGEVGIFAEGERVRDAVLRSIEGSRVTLDRRGQLEYLDLIDAGAPARPAAPSAPPAGEPLAQELERGIRKTGELSYEIQRTTLEAVLANTNLLVRSARIVPEVRDGRPAGFRLFSVRPDGPFGKIGMQNGDVISSINGLELVSMEKSLEVYGKLRAASHLSLALERSGRKVTIEYGIR
jgi:general secretion pathway protein C